MALPLTLADMLTFLGLAGCLLAIACALIAAVAFGVGSANSGGIATFGWLAGLMLSLCGGFVENWMLPAAAVGVLPFALILTGAVAVLRTIQLRRSTRLSR